MFILFTKEGENLKMADLSRAELILRSKINGTLYTKRPLSRVETLLMDIGSGGGGSSGPTEGQDLEPSDATDIMSVISTDNDEEEEEP